MKTSIFVLVLVPGPDVLPPLESAVFYPPPAFCLEPPYTGHCMAIFIRYFYNANSGLCETFEYGGCGGMPNNFLTSEDCMRTCGGAIRPWKDQ
ncbi:serum basic protease inhibitor-like [Balaenoptera musculus]|uniref:Serum basic protease inhibitor-like n=1 Tax=Balaenoptera musculus TaxID=9771 RepID=A0A8B8VF45_BALMU|nr:serum basic protease inhibitor-like [Balaenoptera musculus]